MKWACRRQSARLLLSVLNSAADTQQAVEDCLLLADNGRRLVRHAWTPEPGPLPTLGQQLVASLQPGPKALAR